MIELKELYGSTDRHTGCESRSIRSACPGMLIRIVPRSMSAFRSLFSMSSWTLGTFASLAREPSNELVWSDSVNSGCSLMVIDGCGSCGSGGDTLSVARNASSVSESETGSRAKAGRGWLKKSDVVRRTDTASVYCASNWISGGPAWCFESGRIRAFESRGADVPSVTDSIKMGS